MSDGGAAPPRKRSFFRVLFCALALVGALGYGAKCLAPKVRVASAAASGGPPPGPEGGAPSGPQPRAGGGMTIDQLGWRQLAVNDWRDVDSCQKPDKEGGRALMMNGAKCALLPDLVPPSSSKYVFKHREHVKQDDVDWDHDFNRYKYELETIKHKYTPPTDIVSAPIIKTTSHWSWTGGHSTVHVYDDWGTDMFNIRSTRHNWNPMAMLARYSFRIVPAGSKDNDAPLFTINRDRYLGFTETWRVYRGSESDDMELYRAEGQWWHGYGAKMKIFRGQTETEVASIAQASNQGARDGASHPDEFKVEVHEDEDAGLILMLSLIIDHVDDKNDSPRADADDDPWVAA